jgi:hypothetical protein
LVVDSIKSRNFMPLWNLKVNIAHKCMTLDPVLNSYSSLEHKGATLFLQLRMLHASVKIDTFF